MTSTASEQARLELNATHPVIAGYQVGDIMGRGPLGTVHYARHQATGEIAVIRGFARPAHADEYRWKSARDQFRDLLTIHQRVADLSSAPATLQRIVEFGEEKDLFWVASEYFEARPLHQVLREEGPQSLQWAITIMRQVGEAVDWAAEHGLCHTDLTPANIMIVQDRARPFAEPRVEVINFGLANLRRKYGSPYAAPEQQNSSRGDIRSAVYAAGALLYEILSGKSVFTGTADEIAQKIRTAVPEPLAQLPVFVQNIVNKMLSKDPAHRYARILDAVNNLRDGKSPAADRTFAPALSQIAMHLGQATKAQETEARDYLQMERLPEIPRGTAHVPLNPLMPLSRQ